MFFLLFPDPDLLVLKQLKEKLFAEITTVPQLVDVPYFRGLNGLRAIAIIMVLLYHFGANHYLMPFHILINGDLGVSIFFVISGFLITTLLLKEKLKYGEVSLKSFYLRRLLRIVPVAYLFLFVIIILSMFYKFRITLGGFISSFLFYKNWPYQSDSFTGHFWSLAAEVQFYLICPFLMILNINRYMIATLFVIIAVPLISVLGFYHVWFLFTNPFIHSITQVIMYFFWRGPFMILIGSLTAILLFKGMINIKEGSFYLSFILLLVAIIISTKSFLFYSKYVSEYVSAILIAWVILLNLKGTDFLSDILEKWGLVKVGVLSYGLYIWQQPFIGIKTWQPWMQPFHNFPLIILIIIKLIIVFLIAFLSYYFFELRFLKLKKRR